ncbi:MAG: histidine phosphatase family protein, partial [Anaerolineae bacterium]
IKARYAEQFERRRQDPLHVAPPGGETVAQVRERVIAAMEEIIRKHPHGTVVIVSHGFALALALVHFQQRPIEEIWKLIPENSWPKVLDVFAPESTGQLVETARELGRGISKRGGSA